MIAESASSSAAATSIPWRPSHSVSASSRSARSRGELPNFVPAAARQSPRARSTAAVSGAVNRAEPRARAVRSTSASRALSSPALRTMADAGLFSSCARPAASLPSEAIFSTWRSLDVNWRARSSMTCTKIDVSSWQSRIRPGISSRGTMKISVGTSALTSPGEVVRREYGRTPVTSPPRHSMALCGPAPRSMWIERWPERTTKRPRTGLPFAVRIPPVSSFRRWPRATSHASCSGGAPASVRCAARRA